MQHCQGLPASGGIAIAPAWIYRPHLIESVPRRQITDGEAEWARLQRALAEAKTQLQALATKAQQEASAEEAAIFEAHQLFLEDNSLLTALRQQVIDNLINAEAAVEDAFEHYAGMLLALEDPYFQARAQDVRDVKQRLLRLLTGSGTVTPRLHSPAIVLAEDLTPSDTIGFDKAYIRGLCTVRGGPTSHTAILARALGVPAVVSAPLDLTQVHEGDMVIVDGNSGEVIINATGPQIELAQQREAVWQARRASEQASAHEAAITKDGQQVEVVANVGNAEDAGLALAYGAEGIGLLRTEFLYLNRSSLPPVDVQAASFRRIFQIMGTRPVVVRTLDIGGDKAVSYLGLQAEPNPFLGWRAIRMMNERPEILADQFRALLQAAAGLSVDLRIMLPLVSTTTEVAQARTLFRQICAETGVDPATIQFGMMVEVPAAALLAEHFAALVDFFSIGTNDLTQYTLAVDRTNERVAALASPYHPAVLRLIARTIEAGHTAGKWVGMCGEFAGDPLATPLLLGLGLDEFSMAPAAIPAVKNRIRQLQVDECQQLARQALQLATATEVRDLLARDAPLAS